MHSRFAGFAQRPLPVLLLFCLGCVAQSSSPDLDRRIERQIRAYYQIPANVDIKLGARKGSDFPDYDSLMVTFSSGTRKQENEFLLSKDGKTLIRMTKLDLTKDPFAENMNKINLAGRPVRGNKDAKVTIVNYDDFQCPYCARMHQLLTSDILKHYGDRVRIIYKDYPLQEIHLWARRAAVDANCLAQHSGDAFWGFADYVHANQREITGAQRPLAEQWAAVDGLALQQGQKNNVNLAALQSCVKSQPDQAVRDSIAEAEGLGVSATPTLFVNGQKMDGAVPAEVLHAMIDNALKDAGEKPGANEVQSVGTSGR